MFAAVREAGATFTFDQLRVRLNEIATARELKELASGMVVLFADTGETLLSYEEQRPLNPASTMKLVTSWAALKALGRDYRFTTRVYVEDLDADGNVRGNLVIRGGGDPVLTQRDLWALVRELRGKGVRSIWGDLLYNDTFFDDQRRINSEFNTHEAYNSPIGALSLEGNVVTVHNQAPYLAERPVVVLEPQSDYFHTAVQAKVVRPGKRIPSPYLLIVEPGQGFDSLILKGEVEQGSQRSDYVAVSQPGVFTASVLARILKDEDIFLKGKIRAGSQRKGERPFTTLTSPPLSVVLHEVNKHSNNFIAEQVLKTLGAEFFGTPGSTRKGLQVLQTFLKSIDIPTENLLLDNGSGLSRTTRFTARAMAHVLRRAYLDPEIGPEYLASLGVFGVDGTVRRRSAPGEVRAKTGSINQVSCLAGYAWTRDVRPVVFVLFFNGIKGDLVAVTTAQNRICEAICLSTRVRPQTSP
ncbi:MAG: D-alanyl-D-alanine carboxypeptidase/D-alanyl-D-alanine-endopeptidase [Deltaproteobacteria bacterium RIFOXYA12_FULL_61_11]|nr:MAG: D-alanyl-D-alanine carboxypeptidase/D-alanyl-D-alanine-endopeptidase [Deltaproteobacteria bacterium RIFOXYA12_FULL_61_11]